LEHGNQGTPEHSLRYFFVHDKGRYRQLVSVYRKRLLTKRFRHFDFAEIPAPTAKEIPVKAFLTLTSFIMCAVQRHGFPAGANPARQLSFQPVAIGAVVEVTKRLKPPV
jgi:hypothetical protein